MSQPSPAAKVDSPTEGRNPRTTDIDTLPTIGVLERLNDEDARVAPAVRHALPQLAQAVDAAVERWKAGGSIHYFGAGTSGRLAVLDAAELPPTYGIDPSRAVAHHAGGAVAIGQSVEGVEDDVDAGRQAAAGVGAGDVAIGLAASGRTPFVRGALEAAREVGAYTVLVSSAPAASIAEIADVHVFVDTGPEAVAGSTRMKAGTAQKLVLNGFSTALMIRLGKTYSNLMVDVARSNAKLRGRAIGILEQASGAPAADCGAALDASDGEMRTALVCLLAGVRPDEARGALARHDGRIREAVATLEATAGISSHSSAGEVPMEQ